MVRSIFVAFEGIDGSGKSSQIAGLSDSIRANDKYQPVLLTREPTYRANEIQKRLLEDNDAFSGGERLAHLYVEDRRIHCNDEIGPMLRQNVAVLCDRYSLSTLAYQSSQGVELNNLIKMHEGIGVITPDITFYISVPQSVALERMAKRGGKIEKFEKDLKFTEKLIETYNSIIEKSKSDKGLERVTGPIQVIDGNQSKDFVAQDIRRVFELFYK